MEHWEADFDNALIRSGEESGTPTARPDRMCEICGDFFYKLYTCAGCGQISGCRSCMIKKGLEYYCDPDCIEEQEE